MTTDEKDDCDRMAEQFAVLERLEAVERVVAKLHKKTQRLNADMKKC